MLRNLALFLCAGLSFAQSIPTPESVLGHKPGDDFYLANYTESRDYFRKLAAASDRVKLINVGKTTRGLDWEIAIISSPANLAKLDRYKEISQRLARGRGLDDASAKALAREGKAIVHIDGGLHSTEVAGAQQSIALAYKLVSAQGDPDVDLILDNVILMLWPTLNPDGQNEVVSWYRRNVGTPYETAPLPDLYQEYVGHDNNRDGYMNNMLESRDVTRTELEWDPVIFYCHHQIAPFPTRIFIPPFTEPISSNIHPLMARWLNVMGIDMAAYLDEHGMPGAVHRVGFDNWYPGFLDFTHIFRNSISFFTETALYSYATPHFYSVNDFPRDRQQLRSEIFYSSPWKGGWWRLGDAVRYMLGASMSVLDTAARHRESLLYNRYQAARDNIAKFRQDPPFAYVIPHEQRDLNTASTFVEKLLINGLEVHQATRPFAVNGREYKDAWVVLMDQPFSPLAKELIEKQEYPDLRTTPNGPPIRPYDVAGWTLPLQMGVEVTTVLTPLNAEQRAGLQQIEKVTLPAGAVQGSGAAFVISRNTNESYRALNEALAGGAQAGFGKDGIVLSGITADRAGELARKHSLPLQAIAQKPTDAVAVKKPRLGLYRGWQASIDEGWTRWILEEYGFAPITLRNGDVQAGHLRDRFDAILLADASARSIMDGFLPGTIPGEFAGGIGEAGSEALREFVREGGTLIAFNNATLFAIEQFHLPVVNVLAGLNPDQFYCSGSLLRVELRDPLHPVAAGMPRNPTVMFERGPAFDTRAGFRGNVLATYPREDNPLASGYLLHPERVQGKAAAVEAFYGDGRIYLLGFRPQWRGQSHGTYKLFFNAIYDSPASARPTVPARATVSAAPADPVRALTARVRSDFTALIAQNRAFFAARGQAALDERAKLNAAVDAFEKDRIQEVQDTAAGLDGDAKKRASDLVRAMRRAAADLRSKEVEAGVDADAFAQKYGIQE
jgi:hypothetical protein